MRRSSKRKRLSKPRGIEISFGCDASVINIDEIAERYGVSIEALREVIKGQNKPDYSLLGNQLVSNRVLETIQRELMGVERHNDAIMILDGHGIKAYSQALSLLGYRVKWSGLDPENAEIVKMCIEEGGLNS